MPPALVRSRRLAGALALLVCGASLNGCSLGGDSTLPAFTNPATQTYATNTGVTIANMTRVSAQLYSQDIVVGTGRTVIVGDSMAVYYVGRLSGGFQFDARARPATPYPTALDTTRIIKGWVDGLAGMRIGGSRRLAIGPELGYRFATVRDNNGGILIPANSVLVFDVELVDVFRVQ